MPDQETIMVQLKEFPVPLLNKIKSFMKEQGVTHPTTVSAIEYGCTQFAKHVIDSATDRASNSAA